MTKDDILKLAREVGAAQPADLYGRTDYIVMTFHEIERFATLLEAKVRADEREACAKAAEETVCDMHLPTGIKIYGTRAAKAIRARGKK